MANASDQGLSPVSLCLIVRNEAHHLARCLRSVADLVGEMIVVDTGSTDQTREVATQLGARVYDFAWCDSFAAARNESLRHATGVFQAGVGNRTQREKKVGDVVTGQGLTPGTTATG